MKNLVINYNSLLDLNIGDYIQSLAAKQYFDNNKVVYCERDELNNYTGEPAKVIYNCWFTAKPDNFPPSNDVYPLFRSFHLNSGIADKVLSKQKNVEYFKKYEPIGCRDINSANTFKSYGIDAYFSGCLTTTLGNTYKFNGDRKGIYVVDIISTYPSPKNTIDHKIEILDMIFFSLFNIKQVISVYKNLMKNNPIKSKGKKNIFRRWLYCSRTYKICKEMFDKEALKDISYITHLYDKNDISSTEDRFARADELLTKYSRASLVLSSRIHCILPCLGMNTSAIYFDQINDHALSSCRKKGLIELFNIVSLDKTKIVSNKFGKLSTDTSILNSNDYKKYSDNLTEDCTKFINM
ncbi:polysaccharide pyruvyl transferase family protein [Photobacterium damselae subsp. damselae]|uniref:polysaccharide pyruvyl transferase family protein n=1 Tax=Photobacterium damselae TaxID=38293 RepID=UPI000A2FD200|nr:polysaccharide pyruvyl transferase family protein [Photobacterium damselae]ARR49849.1 hypothetical protein CAY62_09870 [Photobacterium damselae subsp. damselae]QAY35605.1 polysaccharide pyruvyl transferase family protein [Photobacterium damselae subsp. damselae]